MGVKCQFATWADWIRVKTWNRFSLLKIRLIRHNGLEFGAESNSQTSSQKRFPFSKVLELWLFISWCTGAGLVFKSIPCSFSALSLFCSRLHQDWGDPCVLSFWGFHVSILPSGFSQCGVLVEEWRVSLPAPAHSSCYRWHLWQWLYLFHESSPY